MSVNIPELGPTCLSSHTGRGATHKSTGAREVAHSGDYKLRHSCRGSCSFAHPRAAMVYVPFGPTCPTAVRLVPRPLTYVLLAAPWLAHHARPPAALRPPTP